MMKVKTRTTTDIESSLNILQVNTLDKAGGAESIAWNLFAAYRKQGHKSWLAVGIKLSKDQDVFDISSSTDLRIQKFLTRVLNKTITILSPYFRRLPIIKEFMNGLHRFINPIKSITEGLGHEYFDFPASRRLLTLTPLRPAIIHGHNLHGNYFDLRTLTRLSQHLPVILTLHDAWLTTGHCAHSFSCNRWETGCGQCPDLTIYPSIRRDATRYNWKRKQSILMHSRLYIATPSHWLMQRVNSSMLASSIVESRVIPNGVDLGIFCKHDQRQARQSLGLPLDSKILLFAANGIRSNPWKDFRVMRNAVQIAAEQLSGQEIVFLALGENSPEERIGDAIVKFIPRQSDPYIVAKYYQASDIYLHAAKADTFPTTVLESLACGCPVIATFVGGIPEQIKSLNIGIDPINKLNPSNEFFKFYDLNEATGVLIPPGNADAMAQSIVQLLADQSTLNKLSENAEKDARIRFDLERQVQDYLSWYKNILYRDC